MSRILEPWRISADWAERLEREGTRVGYVERGVVAGWGVNASGPRGEWRGRIDRVGAASRYDIPSFRDDMRTVDGLLADLGFVNARGESPIGDVDAILATLGVVPAEPSK